MIAVQECGGPQVAARAGLAWPDATAWAMRQAVQAGIGLLHQPEEREVGHAAREVHPVLLGPDAARRGAGRSMVALLDVVAMHGPRVGPVHLRQSRLGLWSETLGPGDVGHPAPARARARAWLVLEPALEEGAPSAAHTVDAQRPSLSHAQEALAKVRRG